MIKKNSKNCFSNKSNWVFDKKWAFLPLFFLLMNFTINAQTVKGQVNDALGFPLIGATVLVQGTTTGTITDFEGKFEIEANSDDVLLISYLGYKTQEIVIGGNTNISIGLAPDTETLDEVIVIGYGKQKKSHLTGSISKVTNENLDQIPLSRVDDALIGQVAGVNIQNSNPAAGEAPTIRIRGQGSISFDANPLVVVDGISVGTDPDFLSSLDMNDIESIEILKDAASSAIYGSRGANGIIMITTKEGKEGPVKFSYDSYVGFKEVPSSNVLTTVSDWLTYTRDNNDGVLPEKLQYVEALQAAGVPETIWEEVMFDGGTIQSHALSARGGTKNTKFRASLSYLDDEGVLLTDNYEKINFRLNLKTQVNQRLSFGVTVNPSYTEQRRFPIGIHDAVRQHAWLPLYLDATNIKYVNRFRENGRWADAQIGDYAMERMFDDYDLDAGTPSEESSGTDISGTSNQSALAKVLERDRKKKQTKIYSNAFVNVNLTEDLFFKQTIGGDIRFTENTRWQGILASRNGAADSESILSNANQTHLISESTLNYSKDINRHEVNVVLGFAFENWNRIFSQIDAAGFDSDLIQTIPAANVVGARSSASKESLVSYISRLNYAFDDKYLISLSARADGSSKFGPDNKFGFFPAVSVGWRVSEEGFLRDNDFVDEMKVRFSYGITGSNAGIGEYDHIGLLAPVGTAIGGGAIGFNALNISNSELQWEKLVEWNPGIDMSFLAGRFGLSFDYYNRTSEDLLLNLPVPSVTGFETALVNRGVVENKGYELELIARPLKSSLINWTTSALVTHNQNTLVDFAGSSGLISTVDSKRPAEWIALEGHPISSFYGYVVDKEIGLEYLKNPFYPINGQSQDIYVKDLNGDGVIDTDDRTILGSPYPDLVWSWNNSFTLGDFDLSVMINGSQGAEVRNISSQYIRQEFSSNQDYTSSFEDGDLVQQRIFTSDDIQDADYLSLRNVILGYSFGASPLQRVGISKLRLYVSGQNLIYRMADNYVGYNPEGVDQGLGNPLTWGYQRGPAPIYRTISGGINVSF